MHDTGSQQGDRRGEWGEGAAKFDDAASDPRANGDRDSSRVEVSKITIHPAALAAMLLGVSLVSAAFAALIVRGLPLRTTTQGEATPGLMVTGAPAGAEASTFEPAGTASLSADDLTKVDLAEVVAQAAKVATKVEPRATSIAVVRAEGVAGGVLDATRPMAALIVFAYHGRDDTRPPGQDVLAGTVTVRLEKGKLMPFRAEHHDVRGAEGVVPCSSRQAFGAAIEMGMPANAVTTTTLMVLPSGSGMKPQWQFLVEGHPELGRSVDGLSCAPIVAARPVAVAIPEPPAAHRRRTARPTGSPHPGGETPIDSFP